MTYVLEDDTSDDGKIRRYPIDRPYTQRDQGLRGADDTIYVVLCDIVDVLESELASLEMLGKSLSASLHNARLLMEEADDLPWDDSHNWTDRDEDENASEKLQDMLQQAEQLDHIYVDWNGDAGTVTVTLSDYWEEMDA